MADRKPLVNVTGEDQQLQNIDTLYFNQSVGECYMNNNATQTIITSSGVLTKALGTTTGGELVNFTSPSSNRLTYSPIGITKSVRVICSGSILQSSGNNKVMKLQIFKNGLPLVNIQQQLKNVATGEIKPFCLTGRIPTLTANDYVELWITNVTDTSSIVVNYMNLSIN